MAKEHGPSLHRLLAFSDGVVAIAITLLILPLTEIEAGPDATVETVLVANNAALFAFALSFAVIANYWTIHHDIFRPVRRLDGHLLKLNLLWLAAIVFLPFPTALIADRVEGGFGTLYIGTLLVVSVLNLVLGSYVDRHPELTDSQPAGGGHLEAVVAIAVFATAAVISLFFPRVGVWSLLLLFPALAIAGRRTARTSQSATKS